MTSANCTGPHGERATCLDSHLNVPILKSGYFLHQRTCILYLALGSINCIAGGVGGKPMLACVLRRADVPYCPTSPTRHNSWFSPKQGVRRVWVIPGSSDTRGHHQELGACLAWKPPWGQLIRGLAGPACEFLPSDRPPQLPPPSSPAQVRNHSWAPAKWAWAFITLDFPRSSQSPGSRGAAGQKPGLGGREWARKAGVFYGLQSVRSLKTQFPLSVMGQDSVGLELVYRDREKGPRL